MALDPKDGTGVQYPISDDDPDGLMASNTTTKVVDVPVVHSEPEVQVSKAERVGTRDDVPEASKTVVKQALFGGIPMAPIHSVKPSINTLIYGRPGSGKTFLTATAQKSQIMSPMLYVSAEAGSSTIRQVDPSIMVIPDPQTAGSVTWEQLLAIYDELDRQCYNTKDGCEFRTVSIDTGTELQKINMNWVMDITLAAHPDRDPDVPGLHDWGKSTNSMRTMIRRFR